MATSAQRQKGVCCIASSVLLILIAIIIMIANSFSIVPQNYVGLDYSSISKSLDSTPYEPGLYFLGLGHNFITFPTTLQTVQFSTADHDLLHTRTKDGLPLILGVSFQYVYTPEHVYDLYLAYLGEHARVLFLAATNIINDVATQFTAYDYFDDKRGITVVMQNELNTRFKEKFFCSIYALQIRIFELPPLFDNAVQQTITTQQNISVTEKYIENVKVSLETNIIVAKKDANVTVLLAGGNAAQVTESQRAIATQTAISTNASMEAYSAVASSLSLDAQELLQYAWIDSLADTNSTAQLLVGVDPATYISGGRP